MHAGPELPDRPRQAPQGSVVRDLSRRHRLDVERHHTGRARSMASLSDGMVDLLRSAQIAPRGFAKIVLGGARFVQGRQPADRRADRAQGRHHQDRRPRTSATVSSSRRSTRTRKRCAEGSAHRQVVERGRAGRRGRADDGARRGDDDGARAGGTWPWPLHRRHRRRRSVHSHLCRTLSGADFFADLFRSRTCLLHTGKMDRFCAIILFAAACGDNVVPAPGPTNPGGTTDPSGGLTPQPRTVPQVCGDVEWQSVIANKSGAMDLSVAARQNPLAPSGAALLVAPRTGGALTGFTVDARMDDG